MAAHNNASDFERGVIEMLEDWRQTDYSELAGLPTTRQSQPDPFEESYGRSRIFNISKGLINGCAAENCTKTTNLSRCTACTAVYYCGHEHQVASRPSHRSACNKIKKAIAHLDKEERAMKRSEGDDVFEQFKGMFWGVHETRAYMRARMALTEEFMRVNTRRAQQAALEHDEALLQLRRGDNMGVRDVMPGLYLRLGREQDCYDFIKWWITTGQDMYYDWGNLALPYLDVKDADIFESVEKFIPDHGSLSHDVAITLIKVRLLIDVQAVQQAREEAGPHVSQELVDDIAEKAISCSIANQGTILKCKDSGPLLAKLKTQVGQMHKAINKKNKHFWPALVKPGNHLNANPSLYSRGNEAEMQLVLQYSYNAWNETPGAIDVIKALQNK